jgi:hypothetical protein
MAILSRSGLPCKVAMSKALPLSLPPPQPGLLGTIARDWRPPAGLRAGGSKDRERRSAARTRVPSLAATTTSCGRPNAERCAGKREV